MWLALAGTKCLPWRLQAPQRQGSAGGPRGSWRLGGGLADDGTNSWLQMVVITIFDALGSPGRAISHSQVRLEHLRSRRRFDFLVEKRGDAVLLSPPEEPFRRALVAAELG